jgi:hypothetical protein
MSKQKTKKYRKKRMRSYRKIMHFLWAFGIAGIGLGGLLIGWFGLHRQWKMVIWGIIYILFASILLGIRGILAYLDQERKRRRQVYSGPRPA